MPEVFDDHAPVCQAVPAGPGNDHAGHRHAEHVK